MSAIVKIYRAGVNQAPRYFQMDKRDVETRSSRDLMGAEFFSQEEIKKGTAFTTLNLGEIKGLAFHGSLSLHPGVAPYVTNLTAPSIVPPDYEGALLVSFKVKEDIPAGTTLFTLNLID